MFRLIKIATVAWMAIKWYRRRKTAPAGERAFVRPGLCTRAGQNELTARDQAGLTWTGSLIGRHRRTSRPMW